MRLVRVVGPLLIVSITWSFSLPGNRGIRYKEPVFSRVRVTPNVVYGQNTNQQGKTEELLLDVYEPESDAETNRPVMILAHGGGFIFGDKSEFTQLASYFARAGYVVASINYRLLDFNPSTPEIRQGILEAVYDMKAAVRYFRKTAGIENPYRINPQQIFVGGYSAGAVTALHCAYLSSAGEVKAIGGDVLYQYARRHNGLAGDSGNPGPSSAVQGVINISGALANVRLMNPGEPPVYSIHGTADEIVPFRNGASSESGVQTQGSGLIHEYAQQQGMKSVLNAVEGGDHSAFDDCGNCPGNILVFLYNQLFYP